MAYLVVEDFKLGMDRRKKRISGQAGALWLGVNGQISRGGDFERRKKFVAKYNLPAGLTAGLAALNGRLFTFGNGASPVGMPAGITYKQVAAGAGAPTMTKLLDFDAFAGKLYTVSEYDDGNIWHHYDGARVVDWDTLSASIGSNDSVATALAAKIDLNDDVSAVAVGNVITITANAANTPFTIVPSTTNNGANPDQDITVVETQPAAPGDEQINTATVIGTFEAADVFTLTINGIPYSITGATSGIGRTALTYQQKIYSMSNTVANFCALNAPTQWGTGTGDGFIDMANQSGGNEVLIGAEEYQNKIAFFSRNNIRIWLVDVDPADNVFQQTVKNSGALSNRSIIPYGSIDVFYLNRSGVRSLRARDSSNAPAVNDVGVAIDSFIKTYMKTLSDEQVQDAVAIIGEDDRYWLAIGKRIFVFSYFSGAKINAWTYYDLDEIGEDLVTDVIRIDEKIYLRAGDTVYVYGGDDGDTYPDDDAGVAEAHLPFLSAGTPATFKGITGFDLGIEGEWEATLLPDPARETVELPIGTFNKPTFSQPREAIQMPTSMFSLKMVCSRGGAGVLTSLAIHYDVEEAG